jgi:hypothetical protein
MYRFRLRLRDDGTVVGDSRFRGNDGINPGNQENLMKTCIEQSRNIPVQTEKKGQPYHRLSNSIHHSKQPERDFVFMPDFNVVGYHKTVW